MPIARFSVENYRCFPKAQEVELRPITVVLGKNNSGKSALVRAPLVLSTGVRTDSPLPFDLDQLGDAVPAFPDLIYGTRPHGAVRVRMDFEGGGGQAESYGLDATVQNVSEWQTQVVSELALRAGSETVRYEWLHDEVPWAEERPYVFRMNGHDAIRHKFRFQGLLPTVVPISQKRRGGDLSRAADRIRAEFDRIRYLGPYRQRPDRLYRIPSRVAAEVGGSGEATLGILAHDVVRQQGSLIKKINGYLPDNLPGWTLDVSDQGGGMHSVVFRSTIDDTLQINLGDAGTGVAQLLPILVQRAMDAATPPAHPILEIIEEPELHLHPSAHALVADLLLDSARESNVRFLVETHSETFLLRLRRRVAEGNASPDTIAIYFVEHSGGAAQARRIGIDSLGNLDYWPRGVFSEDFEETRKLAAAQKERFTPDAR
ncbi:hypothetical protein FHS43_004931 [Streptosporangium becharense]|uniref:DUF3696 domain-containing protein n=1 Tax=Streptosporangium becharense TaxID=1816182 RepID=A0A7W9ICM8_9ACTN|nr:DUF3696 domain-containing protein [Streptosporangium becharense]MBB2913622.1 hypothetical protein [Streptosporangium becharense]MBB5817703.1 hypothetical protein [Streptosporangium becharense]